MRIYPAYALPPRNRSGGKNIVITGASRGIGRATALELLTTGANVWGTSRTPAAYPAISEYPLLTLDLEDPASIGSFVPAIGAATGGHVDVLINNAGRFVFGSTTPLSADPRRSRCGRRALRSVCRRSIWVTACSRLRCSG